MDLFDLSAVLRLDTSQYERGIDSARRSAQGFAKSTNGINGALNKAQQGFTVFKGVLSNVISSGINTVASAITNNLGGAISRLDILKNYEIVMKNLGHGTTEARQAINKLSDGIDGLPTTLPAIASVQQQFVALGGGLKQATDLTIALNNATLAGGQGQEAANSAMQQWYQMIAAGKPDLMSMRIINEAMPAQLDAISKAVLNDKATWQDLNTEWQKNPEITKKVKDAILDLNENGYEIAGKKISAFKDQAIDANKGIQTSITNIKTAIQKGLADVLDNALGYGNIATFLEGIKSQIKEAFGNFNFLIDTAQSDNFGIGYALQLGVEQAISALDKLYKATPKILKKISSEVSKIAEDIDVPALFGKLIDVVVNNAPMILDTLGTMLNDLGTWISENGAEIIVKLGEGMIKALPSVVSFAGQVVNAILKVVVGLPVRLLAMGASAVGSFILGLLKKANDVATAAGKLVSNAVKGLQKLPSKFLAWAGKGISAFVKGISNGAKKAVDAAKKLASGAVDKLKAGFDKVKDIGMNVVKGIGQGITNGKKWIEDRIREFVGNVKSFLKRLFKIGSPSKWARDEIGKMIDAGLALGIEQNAGMIDDAMEDLMPDIASTAKSLTSTVSGAGKSIKYSSPVFNTSVTVDGAEDPDEWGMRFADRIKMELRTV